MALQWAAARQTQELGALILLSAPLASPPGDALRDSLRASGLPVLDISWGLPDLGLIVKAPYDIACWLLGLAGFVAGFLVLMKGRFRR